MFGTLSYLRFVALRIVREKGMEKKHSFFYAYGHPKEDASEAGGCPARG